MPGACDIQNFLTLRLALLTNQIARILLGVVQQWLCPNLSLKLKVVPPLVILQILAEFRPERATYKDSKLAQI